MATFAAFLAIENFLCLIDVEMARATSIQRTLVKRVFAILEFEGLN